MNKIETICVYHHIFREHGFNILTGLWRGCRLGCLFMSHQEFRRDYENRGSQTLRGDEFRYPLFQNLILAAIKSVSIICMITWRWSFGHQWKYLVLNSLYSSCPCDCIRRPLPIKSYARIDKCFMFADNSSVYVSLIALAVTIPTIPAILICAIVLHR